MPNSLLSRRLVLPSLACAGLVPSWRALAEPPLTMQAFRDELIAVGRRRFPEMALEPGRVASEVRSQDHNLRLENIFAQVQGGTPAQREALIVAWLAHFTPAADAKADTIKTATDDWEHAKPLLRPKLLGSMPPGMRDRLVWQLFVGGLTTVYAIDLGDKDLYVAKDKAAKWRVAPDFIHSRAVANLEAMSSALGRAPHDDKGALVNIRFSDGYDAARLILPGLRARLLGMLGSPFHAAVPARDLMMAWSTGDGKFEREMARQAKDFSASMDHPVSGSVFIVDADGVRPA